MKIKTIVFLAFLLICSYSTILDDITSLHGSLYKNYWADNSTFKILRTWQHLQGLFQSSLNQNFVDDRNGDLAAAIRQLVIIDDENMFVTSFVLYGLLEAQSLSTLKTDKRFGRSLQALSYFRDKNQPEGVPQYTFWPQKLVNGTWSSVFNNIISFSELIPDFSPQVQNFLSFIGLGIWTSPREIKKQFCIPADVDDSSVNIALLGYMKQLQSKYYSSWQKQNADLDGFYKRVLKYAYRPFDPINSRSDEIDPRTYFILHNFLKKRKAQANAKKQAPRLILPTTWLINRDETIVDIIPMPSGSNNVDANVNANFLLGLIFQIKSGYKPSAELREVMRDVTDLLVYTMEDAIYRRPDLILTYYPSKYDFYWFVARVVGLLERMQTKCDDADLKYVYDQLAAVIRSVGTRQILKEKHQTRHGYYWAQFLGNYAGKNRNEDAMYSTGVVLNALLDTWGLKGNKSFKYLPNTPKQVKQAVSKGISYLRTNFKTADITKMGNAFFSGDLKIISKQFPPFFPANKLLDVNSRPINGQTATLGDIGKIDQGVMKGFVEDADYQKMLKMEWFQVDVPLTFNGYNDGEGDLFMYWSSPAITQIMMITAFSKYYHATK